MRNAMVVLLVLVGAARAGAGGIDFELKGCTVHKVDVDDSKIVFTVSGFCETCIQDPVRDDRANCVATSLRGCVITITKEAFEKLRRESYPRSSPPPGWTWAKIQADAKGLVGKKAFMQISGDARLHMDRIQSIDVVGYLSFKEDSEAGRPGR